MMKRKQTKEMVNACSVCFDERGWDENPLVYCDGANCNIAVHQACYGILSVPKGNWYCRKCESQDTSARCELCPFKGGALKQTDNGKWAHVVCALYIPEVKFANVTTMEPIVLSDIPKDRFSEICSICTKKGWLARSNVGACMRCNKANCKQQFHVSCAQRAGLLCEETGKNLNNIKYCGYCEDHSSKAKKNNTAAANASGKRSQTYESPPSRQDENTPEPAGSSIKQTQKKKHYGNNGKVYSTLKKDATSPHNLNLIISLSSNPPTVIESPSKVAEAAETDSKLRTATGKGRKHKTSPRAGVANFDDAATAVDVNIADSKMDNDVAVANASDLLASDSSSAVNDNNNGEAVDINSSSDDKGFCADSRKKKSKHRKHFYSSSSCSSSFKKHRFGRKKKYVNFDQTASVVFDDSVDDNAPAKTSEATSDQCSESGVQLANEENAENAENEKSTISPTSSSMNIENIEDDNCANTIIGEGLLVKAEALSSDETTKKQSVGDGRKADVKSAKNVASRYNRVLEELLEKQWDQAGAFLMEQAGHYRVSDLLNELHQVRAEIIREEENQKALLMRRNHLLAVNARLSISNMMPEYTNFVANRDLQTDTEQTLLTGLPISSQVSFQQTKIHSPTSLQDASPKNFDSK